MFKLLFYMAVIGGIGYAGLRIPVEGKTAVQHAREFLAKNPDLGKLPAKAEAPRAEKAAPVASAPTRTAPAKAAPAKTAPAKAPAKAEPAKASRAPAAPPKVAVVRTGVDLPPGETLTERERRALDQLITR